MQHYIQYNTICVPDKPVILRRDLQITSKLIAKTSHFPLKIITKNF